MFGRFSVVGFCSRRFRRNNFRTLTSRQYWRNVATGGRLRCANIGGTGAVRFSTADRPDLTVTANRPFVESTPVCCTISPFGTASADFCGTALAVSRRRQTLQLALCDAIEPRSGKESKGQTSPRWAVLCLRLLVPQLIAEAKFSGGDLPMKSAECCGVNGLSLWQYFHNGSGLVFNCGQVRNRLWLPN